MTVPQYVSSYWGVLCDTWTVLALCLAGGILPLVSCLEHFEGCEELSPVLPVILLVTGNQEAGSTLWTEVMQRCHKRWPGCTLPSAGKDFMLLVYESDGPSCIGNRQSGTWTGFSPSTSVFSWQYLSTNTPHSFIHPSITNIIQSQQLRVLLHKALNRPLWSGNRLEDRPHTMEDYVQANAQLENLV